MRRLKSQRQLGNASVAQENVVRIRKSLMDTTDTLDVSNTHGRVFGETKPTNTMVVVAKLLGDYHVEIEAEALVRG